MPRPRGAGILPAAIAHAQSKGSHLAAFSCTSLWANVGNMPTLLEGDTRQQAGRLLPAWLPLCLIEQYRAFAERFD